MLTIKQVKGLLQVSNISAISRYSGVPYNKIAAKRDWQSGHTQKFSLAEKVLIFQIMTGVQEW